MQNEIDNLLALTSGYSLSSSIEAYTKLQNTLQSAIESQRRSLADAPTDSLSRHALADLLLDYYRIFGSLTCLDECISIYQYLLAPIGSVTTTTSLCLLLDKLASALRARYENLGDIGDIEDAVALSEASLNMGADIGMETTPFICGLMMSLFSRYLAWNERDVFHRAIDLSQQQLHISPSDGSLRVRTLFYLSLLQKESSPRDSMAPIRSAIEAVTLAPPGHPYHALACVISATALQPIFRLTDIEPFCAYTRALCSAIGHPSHFLAELTYATFIHSHTSHAAIDAAVASTRAAWLAAPHFWRRKAATRFGWVLEYAFDATGAFAYLDEMVGVNEKAARESCGEPFWPLRHNLATALWKRYHVTGDVQDLEDAICQEEQCLQPAAWGPHFVPGSMHYRALLGQLLVLRFRRTGAVLDIKRALELHQQCLQILGNIVAHDRLDFERINGLTSAYEVAVERGIATNLDEPISVLRDMLAKRDQNDIGMHYALNALSTCLHCLSFHRRSLDAIREAISLRKRALSLVQDTYSSRLLYVANLAADHALLWELTQNPDDIQYASKCFSDVVNDSLSPPLTRLHQALVWCDSVANADDNTRAGAFKTSISLLPQAVLFGTNFQTRLDALRRAARLSTNAAMHSISASRHIEALQLLEQGRAVLWTQMLGSRGKIRGLPVTLSERLVETSRALELGAQNDVSLGRRQSLLTELDGLITEARRLPGLEDFLHTIPYAKIQSAATPGHIVALVCNHSSAMALVIRASSSAPLVVELEGVNSDILKQMISDFNVECGMGSAVHTEDDSHRKLVPVLRQPRQRNESDTLRVLWTRVVEPVIRALGIQVIPTPEKRPRVHWCPTGQFAFLPLHAAGAYHGPDTVCASDYIVSSYIPTITTLLNAQREPPTRPIISAGSNVLMAAIPSVPGYQSLPHTSGEVQVLRDLIPLTRMLEGDIPVERFLAELPSAAFLHLACHGKQDARNPMNSGFVFYDETVKVSELMDVNVPDACFAFLSACESAMGDKKLPDENIHLAAAMLFIGYRSVVGTLWSMHDADGPTVAARVYSEQAKSREKFDYDAVPRALDAAVRELRASGAPPSRWATWIHMGI